mmetsp:Transcript_29420/g.68085  ORF Transcript_29420/g.68085 Transcript_29420/m.68085 type:complete len:115 (-) Transcript_29420:471-815(-)
MTRIQKESWSSFHKKHQSQLFRYSTKNEDYVRSRPFSSSTHCIYEEEDDKSWFGNLVDMLTISIPDRRNQYDNDSFSSIDSDGSGTSPRTRRPRGLRLLRKRTQGNIKICGFDR